MANTIGLHSFLYPGFGVGGTKYLFFFFIFCKICWNISNSTRSNIQLQYFCPFFTNQSFIIAILETLIMATFFTLLCLRNRILAWLFSWREQRQPEADLEYLSFNLKSNLAINYFQIFANINFLKLDTFIHPHHSIFKHKTLADLSKFRPDNHALWPEAKVSILIYPSTNGTDFSQLPYFFPNFKCDPEIFAFIQTFSEIPNLFSFQTANFCMIILFESYSIVMKLWFLCQIDFFFTFMRMKFIYFLYLLRNRWIKKMPMNCKNVELAQDGYVLKDRRGENWESFAEKTLEQALFSFIGYRVWQRHSGQNDFIKMPI